MTLHIPFDNSYARLPDRFFARLDPTPVRAPNLIAFNDGLAEELGLDPQALTSDEGLAVLAGNGRAEGSDPLAMVYAGHQFGGWSPQLGDGRAHLLGEVIDTQGQRRDIQLKGSGPTPFSRNGDGRAWLGPVMREYLVSEAMHALGVPTTRSLAVVSTGEVVQREAAFPGAVLTRVASSHIRVGTFQYFAARQDLEAIDALMDHVIERHYPDLATKADRALELIRAVVDAQAWLVAKWMGLGFIHGVLNTDNTAISGETIDYGPCAFMDGFHPDTVFSSIDSFGRYAYKNQPDILVWNLVQFAGTLLPLIDGDGDVAAENATEVLRGFAPAYRAAYLAEFRAKLGLAGEDDGDAALIEELLGIMARERADFTNIFQGLGDGSARDLFHDPTRFEDWCRHWTAAREGRSVPPRNPALIPRNHRIEEAIQAALKNDFVPFERLGTALAIPFELSDDDAELALPPKPEEAVTRTFCGT